MKHLGGVIGVGLLIVTSFLSAPVGNIMRINFLDVGQGDAIYIESADGYSMLIDTGLDSKAVFEIDKVRTYKNKVIDVVVLTHFDLDHVGGLEEVLERYIVQLVLLPYLPSKDDPDYEILNILNNFEIGYVEVDYLDDFRLGCCTEVDLLWPFNNSLPDNTNDSSIAMLVSYNTIDLYTGGDLSAELELLSLSSIGNKVEILKLGHHGSKTSTSSEMLGILGTEVGIVSAGVGNSYGHPHSEVLELLDQHDVRKLSTQELGTIRVITDGYGYSFSSL